MKIRAEKVRLIDEKGHQVGVVSVEEGVRLAEAAGSDLVEVAPEAVPPVCRIMDYGKYKYHLHKKEKEAHKKHKEIVIKEIKLRPRIGLHDFNTKKNHVERFVGEGDKVRVTIMFRGRENTHQDLGRVLLAKMADQLSAVALIEAAPKVEGNNMFMILSPKASTTKKEAPRPESGKKESAKPEAPKKEAAKPAVA